MHLSYSRQMVFKLLYVHRKLLSPKTVVRMCPSQTVKVHGGYRYLSHCILGLFRKRK